MRIFTHLLHICIWKENHLQPYMAILSSHNKKQKDASCQNYTLHTSKEGHFGAYFHLPFGSG
uniref:Uncharacterized protein LOC103343167 n=1 Tax=Rhizophora mucronata TaxID=61149 RepID=A0A2P2KSY1_RHIMU